MQQYLELVDRQEYQKAFTYLTKKLKQYEKTRSQPEEFKNLCYLLTCRSISDVDKVAVDYNPTAVRPC